MPAGDLHERFFAYVFQLNFTFLCGIDSCYIFRVLVVVSDGDCDDGARGWEFSELSEV
jgi:hypothetical protein